MERERVRRSGGDAALKMHGGGADTSIMKRGPKGPIRCPGARLAIAAAASLSLLVGTKVDAAPREGFAVEPFTNVKHAGALHHLVYALPALIAERFAQTPPLRFAGRDELFSRTPPTDATWLVRGAFASQSDGKVAITVEVVRAAAPAEVIAHATRAGARDGLATVALDAAAAAFGSLPGAAPTTEALAAARTPFNRDAYSFTLYGRAVAAFHGGGGVTRPTPLGTPRAVRAIELLRHSLLIDPSIPEVRRFMATALLATGEAAPARAMLTYALDVRPGYALALRTLAALDRAAALPIAREHYARLVELDPDDVEARRAYGEMLLESGRLAEAQAQLEAVLAVAPDDARARRHLITALSSRQQGKELASQLEEALRRDPENLDARLDLGAAYLSLGQKPEAAAVYDEVLRRKPRHTGALKLAADLARERGDLAKASLHYARLRVLAPQDPRPVFLLAAAYAHAGDLDKAERLFSDGEQFPGMLAEAYSNLGAIALRRGDPRQALWFLSRAAKRRPGRMAIRYNHALALHALGRDTDALDELHAAAVIEPEDTDVQFLTGVVAVRLGRLEEAKQSFATTVGLDPKRADAAENLALLEASALSADGSPLCPPAAAPAANP
jgi:Flp pilus assembly protein TadD